MSDEESIRSLPKGTDLYHGTSVKEKFRIPNGPAFFSDTWSVAKYFTTWHEGPKPRILRFEVTDEIPRLALIESKQDFDRLAEAQGLDAAPPDTESKIELICQSGYDGWIIPHNYPDGADIMICEPARWIKYLEEEKA